MSQSLSIMFRTLNFQVSKKHLKRLVTDPESKTLCLDKLYDWSVFANFSSSYPRVRSEVRLSEQKSELRQRQRGQVCSPIMAFTQVTLHCH